MNEQENNICALCGGVKRVDWTISFEQCHPVEMRFDPASLAGDWRLCPGHPEPAQHHNGRLDDRLATHDYHADVEMQEDYGMCDGSRVIVIAGGRGDCENSRILLEPAQALSLLDWLLQKRDELTRLAKEQGQ